MLDYNEIITKIREILLQETENIKISNKDVALALDIDYDNFRKQKSRNAPHYPEVMKFLAKRNISINWFFFNQLPESLIESTSNHIMLKYQKNVITSAGGGSINDELGSTPLAIDKQLLDHINSSYKYTEVLKVFGDSMEPDIKDESLVFVDKSQVDVTKSDVYVVNTPDGLFIKRITVKAGKYYMSSTNELYGDILPDSFEIIGTVKGVYSKL